MYVRDKLSSGPENMFGTENPAAPLVSLQFQRLTSIGGKEAGSYVVRLAWDCPDSL